MKYIVLILFVISSLLCSCQSRHGVWRKERGREGVIIDFQANFDKYPVVLFVDGVKEYEGVLTSYASLSSTGVRVKVDSRERLLDVRVIISGVEYLRKLDAELGRYVGISYDWRNNDIRIVQAKNDFFYD